MRFPIVVTRPRIDSRIVPVPDELQRRRAAHHEAAHAVFVVAERFNLRHAFLTRGTTLDGSTGGCTDWSSTNNASIPGRARVFYAGQYAERHLAVIDRSVWVPAHDENWNNDDADAATVLQPHLATNPMADAIARHETAALVARYWRAIANVAVLMSEPSDPTVQAQPCNHAMLVPAGQVVRAEVVRRVFCEDRIAEESFLAYEKDGGLDGKDFDDWMAAQTAVAVAYPEVIEHWIVDDNPPNGPFVAEFRFGSPGDVQNAMRSLQPFAPTGFTLSATGATLTVAMTQASSTGLVVMYVQRAGGEYRRQRRGFHFV